MLDGIWVFLIFSIFLGSGLIPLIPITCLTKVSSCSNHLHLLGFNFRLASLIFWSTACTCLICSSLDLEWMIISSRYTSTNLPMYGLKILFINLWNVTGVLHNLKGITRNWYCPFLILDAVFSQSLFLTKTCQYAEAKSRLVNHLLPQNLLHVSLMLGNGYRSGIVTLFSDA